MKFKITPDGGITTASDKVSRITALFSEIKSNNNEHEYELIASDHEIYSFVEKLQKIRLWLDLRDYIDEVYGEDCVYLEWSYSFEHDRIRIVDIEAYDKNDKRIEVDPAAVLIEIKWLQEINMDMAYAYRARYWDRSNMNFGSPK